MILNSGHLCAIFRIIPNKLMRHLFLSVLLITSCLSSTVLAQSTQPHYGHEQHRRALGTVTGRVQLSDGQVAEQVSVRIKGSGRGTVTAADGSFTLKAPAGWLVITVSCLGCVGQEVAVEATPFPVRVPDSLLCLSNGPGGR